MALGAETLKAALAPAVLCDPPVLPGGCRSSPASSEETGKMNCASVLVNAGAMKTGGGAECDSGNSQCGNQTSC